MEFGEPGRGFVHEVAEKVPEAEPARPTRPSALLDVQRAAGNRATTALVRAQRGVGPLAVRIARRSDPAILPVVRRLVQSQAEPARERREPRDASPRQSSRGAGLSGRIQAAARDLAPGQRSHDEPHPALRIRPGRADTPGTAVVAPDVAVRSASRLLRDVVQGGSKIRRTVVETIQRRMADDPTRIRLVEDVLKLLASGFARVGPAPQARVALKAIEVRVRAGQFDAEDLVNVRERLQQAWVERGEALGNQYKQAKRADLTSAVQGVGNQLQQWADALPAPYDDVVAPDLEADQTELRPGPGNRRVVIPTAKAAGAAIVPIGGIKFSQGTARGTTGAGALLSSVMKHMATTGWNGDPVELARMAATYGRFPLPAQSQGLCSIDNRRLVAAMAAGLTDVPAVTHEPTEAVNAEWAAEDQNALRYPIWTDAGGQIKIDYKRTFAGGVGWVRRMAQNARPETYGDLIVIRTVNQGESMKYFPGAFPLGGSERVPEVTGPAF